MNMEVKRERRGKELRAKCQETERSRCVGDREEKRRKWRERVKKGDMEQTELG